MKIQSLERFCAYVSLLVGGRRVMYTDGVFNILFLNHIVPQVNELATGWTMLLSQDSYGGLIISFDSHGKGFHDTRLDSEALVCDNRLYNRFYGDVLFLGSANGGYTVLLRLLAERRAVVCHQHALCGFTVISLSPKAIVCIFMRR